MPPKDKATILASTRAWVTWELLSEALPGPEDHNRYLRPVVVRQADDGGIEATFWRDPWVVVWTAHNNGGVLFMVRGPCTMAVDDLSGMFGERWLLQIDDALRGRWRRDTYL